MSSLENYKKLLDKAKLRRDQVVSNLESEMQACAEAERLVKVRKEALAFFIKSANTAQEKVSGLLSTIVTSALHVVFGPEYKFEVRFVSRRGSTEADVILLKHDNEVDPMGNSGLGVANIIAITMRAAFIVMEDRLARFMALDEPTAALMVGKQHLAGEVLQTLCKKLGFQILLLTHSPELAEYADTAYHVSMNTSGVSKVRKIENMDEIRAIMEG